MTRIPPIKAVMRPFPYSIDSAEDLLSARRLMAEQSIRHLPVLEQGRLVGVLSARDLDRAAATSGAGRARDLTAGGCCSRPAYAVGLDEPLDNVLLQMAESRYGCVLVERAGRVVGILTTTDLCRLFAEHLRRDFPPHDDSAS